MKPCLLAFQVNVTPAVALAQTNPAPQAARAWRQQREQATSTRVRTCGMESS